MADDIVFDEMLGELRTSDVSGGTGGESYVAGEGIEINGNTISATGGGGEGTVTGIDASVDGGTATITATGSTTSIDIVGTGGVDVKGNTNGAVELDAKDLSDGAQSITKDVKQARFVEVPYGGDLIDKKALTLVHFSDIHGDAAALQRIMSDVAFFGDTVNDVICTGDIVDVSAEQITSWWDANILIAIGNHDDTANGVIGGLSVADRIAYYITPFEANWGITRGEGKSYYYKDYADKNVRLIVLDVTLYNTGGSDATAQTNWLSSLLDGAISSGLHVVIAGHAPANDCVQMKTSFSRYNDFTPPSNVKATNTPPAVVELVASKISAGLHFVGYLVGHLHQDQIFDATGDGRQYFYAITCANVDTPRQWARWSDLMRDSTLDAYNIVTIDTDNSLVRIARGGGANIDDKLRPRETITINYATGEIIDREIPRLQNGFRSNYRNGTVNVARYIGTETITGSTVTIQAGHAYTANVNDTITLNIEAPPTSASYGLDGLLDLNLSGGTVQACDNVYLADTLTENSRNICAVRFIDEIAVVNVITVISAPFDGYVVTVASGTSDGSLYYGLATSTETNVGFNASLNGQTVDLENAVTNAEKNIIGNGFANTVISGGISCTSATTVSNLSLSGVSILGGTMTIQDGNIPADASVTVVGYADIRLASGTGVFDMTGHAAESGAYTGACFTSGGSAYITGTTFANAAGIRAYYANETNVVLDSCSFVNNTSHATDCAYGQNGGSALISGCAFTSNIAPTGQTTCRGAALHVFGGGIATVESCTFVGNDAKGGGGGAFGGNIANTSETTINNCNFVSNQTTGSGGAICVYSSGTIHVSGCTFTQNIARNGGAMLPYGGCVISANACVIDKCSATDAGGATRSDSPASPIYLSGSTITSCFALYGAAIHLIWNGRAELRDCILAYNNTTSDGLGTIFVQSSGYAVLSGCTVTSNNCRYEMLAWGDSTRIDIMDSVVSGNTGIDISNTQGGVINVSGSTIGHARVQNGATLTIAGNNSFDWVENTAGVATVIISSGASINLTSSIEPGASRITVLTGGCVVNGATIAAGTYTQIVSSGGSAVAS